jgi:hypothetical protein
MMARTAEYAGSVSEAGDLMTIRPGWLRLGVVIPVAIMLGVSIVIAVGMLADHHAGQVPWAFFGPVLVVFITWVATRRVRLEITDSVVLVRQGGWRGNPDKQAPRNAITAIHVFPMVISFRGPDKKPIMMIVPNYTPRQMLRVAKVLDVPLYDHRRWFGLRQIHLGRLIYDPRQAR